MFTVDGKPQPWRRARTNGKRFFKDEKTKANQNAWAWACKLAMGAARPIEGPVEMDLIVRFTVPSRASNDTKRRMLSGELRPVQKARGDSDNHSKNADGLNGVAFIDDAQIVDLHVSKIYAPTAGVDVVIRPVALGIDLG